MENVGTLCTTLRVQDGRPLLWSLHVCRLRYFCRVLEISLDLERWQHSAATLMNTLGQGVLRIELSVDGTISFSTRMLSSKNTLTWKPYLEKGSALSRLKRVERERWDKEKKQHAVDVLVLHTEENKYLECCIGNLFVYKSTDSKWYTPPLSKPILPGIMRSVLLSHAPKHGLVMIENSVAVEDSDALWLTNAVRGCVSLSMDGPHDFVIQQLLSDVDESLAFEHFEWSLNQLCDRSFITRPRLI